MSPQPTPPPTTLTIHVPPVSLTTGWNPIHVPALTLQVSEAPQLLAWLSAQVTATNAALASMQAALARIEAYLPAMEKRLMAQIDDLMKAVNDNLAAQTAGFAALATLDNNIDAAILKLGQAAPPDLQPQITALQAMLAARVANTQGVNDENAKLATALGGVTSGVVS